MRPWLVDTGGFIGYLDSTDAHHRRVSAAINTVRPVIWTTMPVVAEAMYMLSHIADGPAALVEMLEDADAHIVPTLSWEDLRRCTALMRKYHDLPMDFADASLVRLAEELHVADLLTVDERGFRVFRIHGRQSFHLVLDDFPG